VPEQAKEPVHGLGSYGFHEAIVERLDVLTTLATEIHQACCHEPEGESPLSDALREMTAAIDRQTKEIRAHLSHAGEVARRLDAVERKLDALLGG
jgi:hypothetical protein